MESMYESLLDGLDDCRWNYLRGLADAAEDEGKRDLARGFRFMAKHHKWPMHFWYGCSFGLSGAPLKKMAEHKLPVGLYMAVSEELEATRAGAEDEDDAQLQSWVSLSRFMAVVAEAIGKELVRPKRQPADNLYP